MTLRMASAVVGLPLLALVIWLGSVWFSIVVALTAALGAFELSHIGRRAGRRPAPVVAAMWAFTLVVAAHIASADLTQTVTLIATGGLVVLAYLVWQLESRGSQARLSDWGITAAAAIFTGGLLGYGPLLRAVEQGRQWVFFVMIVTFAADTSAFFVGKALGKRRLAPTISPGKTWEGAAGGLIGAVGAAFASARLLDLDVTWLQAVALGALMGVFGQLGDLAVSRFKRAGRVKESGWLIPGHGGIMDRLDSIVLNLALVYHSVIWVIR